MRKYRWCGSGGENISLHSQARCPWYEMGVTGETPVPLLLQNSGHGMLGAHAFGRSGFCFLLGFEEFAYERCPAGLMRCSQSAAGVAVEIFVEEDQVAEVGVVGE